MSNERVRNMSILVPSQKESSVPSLGYVAVKNILNQAFPDIKIDPVYLDSAAGLDKTDILLANLYSTLGFVDVMKLFKNQDMSLHKKDNPFITVIGGTGSLNPLPVNDIVDYVTRDENGLVQLISNINRSEAKPWRQNEPIWAKSDAITLIMPTLGCTYNCSFCQLKNQNGGQYEYSDLIQIQNILQEQRPDKILIHSSSILSYPKLDELFGILEKTRAQIFLGSMNLIDINNEIANRLFKLNPLHTLSAEKQSEVQLYFGLETGSDKVLQKMQKPLTRDIAIDRIKILKKSGFKNLGFYLMIGYPETGDIEFKETASMLNMASEIMGESGCINVKCTPFIPHLGTEDRYKAARRWVDCVKEFTYLKNMTRKNIKFDISDPFYYLTSVVLIRGDIGHSRMLNKLTNEPNLQIQNDRDIDNILKELNLPSLDQHLNKTAPMDLSKMSQPYIEL